MFKKFYPSVENKKLNEIYSSEWINLNADDRLSPYLKQQFRKIIKLIDVELKDENFTEVEIEDYLKYIIEKEII